MISEEVFKETLTSCGFPLPTNLRDKYNGLIAAIPKAGIRDKRELAMFLANIYHESQGLKYKREINPRDDYDGGRDFLGRGYIQLTHKYNYKAASNALYSDDRLVQNPELVEESEVYAWDTTAWFWATYVHEASTGDFNSTINAINSIDTEPQRQKRRVYHDIIRGRLGLPDEPHP